MNTVNKSVAIILTTYNPDIVSLKENIYSYTLQASIIIVCDNSDNYEIVSQIERLCSELDNTLYLSMSGNKGIAYAQNRGVDLAISKGFYFFIEMDQDSKLPNGYVYSILSTYFLLTNNNIAIGGVGPIAKSKSQNFIYDEHQSDNGIKFVDKTLSSGFLYTKSVYQLVGGKDESLFIDYVDWDWCWRARSLKLSIVIDNSIEIEHMLGDGHKKILGFYVGLPSPIRLYYQYRNALYMMQRDHVPFLWKLKRLFISLLKVPFFTVLADRRKERLKYISQGFLGFFRGEKGILNKDKSNAD